MSNWKVVTALVLFFPLGLYWMFKYTDWPDKTKWIISSFFALITGTAFISELFYELLFIAGIVLSIISVVWFIHAILRRKQKRNAVLAFALGLFMFVYSTNIISEQNAEAERIAQEELLEKERIAEEERLEQERLAEEQRLEEERLEHEEKLKVASHSIEKLEEEPTRKNYDSAKVLVSELAEPDTELESRLKKGLILVEEYEEALEVAIAATETAENDSTRENYEKATILVSSLSVKDTSLSKRLETVEDNIVAIEKKAEQDRLAKEKAQQEEADRIAKEKAEAEKAKDNTPSSSSSGSQQTNSAPAQTTPPADTVAKTVYIAPQSGTKYHYSPNCRGLSKANSINEISLTDAKNQGYDLCGWEK